MSKETIKIGNTDFTEVKDKISGWTAEQIQNAYPHFHPKVVAEFVKRYPPKKAPKKKVHKSDENND